MSVSVTTGDNRLRIPADVFDLDGFRAWAHSGQSPEAVRLSFINGDIEVDMSPEELTTHNSVKADMYVDFGTLVRSRNLGKLFVDGALLVNEAAGIATEPDLIFCRWETIRSKRIVLAPSVKRSKRLVELRGTPDLVGEVVSNGSVRKDTVHLRRAYYQAGIPEYWLIDARGKSLKFDLLVRGRSAYNLAKPDRHGYVHSRILECSVRLTRETDDLGGPCYRLLHR